MFKKERVIGLDIGSSSIKLVELRKAGAEFEVVRFRRMELEPEEDPALRQLAVAKAVSQAMHREKLKGGWAAVSISGQSAFVKFLKLPRMAEKKVDQIIRYEAQQQVPFPINEVVWDHQILEGKAAAEMEVALVAIKTGIIDQLLQLLEKAKLNIELINTTSLAMYNLFKFCGEQQKATVLLDLGARTTNVIIGSGETIWMRSLPIAGEDITRALAGSLSLSFAEAETRKREKGTIFLEGSSAGVEDPEERKISEAIAPVVADLAGEILNSVTYFNSQYKEIIIERVLLTGGTAGLRNLDRFLEINLGFPVEKFDYLSRFRTPKASSERLRREEDYLGVAAGLALQHQRPVTIGVSLLPEAEVKCQIFRKKKDYVFFAQGLVILIVAALTLLARLDVRRKQEHLKKIQTSYEQFKELEVKVQSVKKKIEPIRTRIEFLQTVHERRLFFLKVFDEMAQVLPRETWLSSLVVQEAELGEGEDYERGFLEDERYFIREPDLTGDYMEAETDLVERKSVSLRGEKEKLALIVTGITRKPLISVNRLVESLEKSDFFSEVKILSADYAYPGEREGFPYEGWRGAETYPSRRRGSGTPGREEERVVLFRIQMLVERATL